MKREVLAPIVASCITRGPIFDVEMVQRALRSGVTVAELPTVVVERRPPRTPLVKRSIDSMLGLLRLRKILLKEAQADLANGPASSPARLSWRSATTSRRLSLRVVARSC